MSSLGSEIQIGNIEAELRQLWLADDANTRASLANFAIYSERPNSLAENTELIAQITAEQSCRAILIHADPACSDTSAKAWVTAHCRVDPRGANNICSEQIAFDLCGSTADLVSNLVFAHLDSDLPLVLWWQDDLNDSFDERLYSRVDRLLVNSGAWQRPTESFARLREARRETSGHMAIHDLSWSRSYHMRLAIASLFDDAAARSALPSLRSVTVQHEDGAALAAKMLRLWIAARLPGPAQPEFHQLPSGPGTNLRAVEFATDNARLAAVHHRGSRFLSVTTDRHRRRSETLMPAGPTDRCGLILELMARAGSNSRYREILDHPDIP